MPKGWASLSPSSLAFCCWVVLSGCLSRQAPQIKGREQRPLINLAPCISIFQSRKEVGIAQVSERGTEEVEAVATPGLARRVLDTQEEPCGEGKHSAGPCPRWSLPSPPLPASRPAPPFPEEPSLLRVSSALSLLSLSLQQVWALGRPAGAGPPQPRLSWGRLPSSGCGCLLLLLFGLLRS